MFRILLPLLACYTLVVSAGAQVAPPERPAPGQVRWPLDLATRYLTSNFMEYRSGRFHAGLDLKTQTVTGFPARAVEDGYVVRLRATPSAYGRAVYLQGVSGRIYVYAHLERFSDHLRALVDAQRALTRSYRVRLQFAPGEVPIKQGDVLGLTGQSGTGGPHLHFEVRDAHNRPTEPLAEGFTVQDSLAPVIHRLRVWPVTPAARIQDGADEHLLQAPDGLSGQQPPLQVSGPVAFSARIVDRSDRRGHSLEPSLIQVHLDGELVFSCHNESYDFAENALQRLEWLVLPSVRERWLHRHPRNTLTGRSGGLWYLGDEGQGLAPGRHLVAVSAADRAGNRTEAHFDLVVDTAGQSGPSGAESAWKPVLVRPEIFAPDSLSRIVVTPFFDVDSYDVRAAVGSLRRRVYSAAKGDPVLDNLVVYSSPATLTPAQRQAGADQGLRPLGVARDFVAATWPIEASLPVRMADPDSAASSDRSTWGLYRWHRDKWDRVTAWPEASGGVVKSVVKREVKREVKLDQPGLHAVLADYSPPVIGRLDRAQVGLGPTGEVVGVTLPRWDLLPVPVQDLGSGLAAETIRVQLDGQDLIAEPDLPRDRILVEFPDAMAVGPHQLRIEVADQVGHLAVRQLKFEARQ